MVRVKNIEESLDFYCNKLGLKEVRRRESEKGKFTLIFLAAENSDEKTGLLELTYNWDPEEYSRAIKLCEICNRHKSRWSHGIWNYKFYKRKVFHSAFDGKIGKYKTVVLLEVDQQQKTSSSGSGGFPLKF